MTDNATRSSLQVYKRLLSYVHPHRWFFFLSIIGFLLYSATQPLFAALIKEIIDTLQQSERQKMYWLPLVFSGLIVIRGFGAFLGNYFLAKVSGNVVHALRYELFLKYTKLPTSYYDSNNSGYLISKITHNVGQVTTATTEAVRTLVREGLTVLGLLIYLFYVNWRLSLVFLAITPIIVVLVTYVGKRLRKISKKIQTSVGDMTLITSELVGGHRVVKSYGGLDYECRRFQEKSWENRRQSLKLATTLAIHNPIIQFVIAIALSVMMYLALFFMQKSTAGDFVAYLTAAFLLPKPIRQLGEVNGEIQKGIVAAESLFETFDETEEPDQGTISIDRVQGKLEFKNLSFKYPASKEWILENITLCIEPGQTVALVGSSGGGKSTLVSLVSRFYDYQQGQILLDGIDIRDYRRESLNRQIALVTQNVTLFDDTVANNIAYGELAKKSRAQIVEAASDAYAKEFIDTLDQGFDTLIGEHGVMLSGGQRQRLALARALLKDAPLLILDEATSALDTESERYIQEALKKIMHNRTTLVVAHRLSTIENADQIIVIDQGRIAEMGTHQELLAKNGAYSKLHQVHLETKQGAEHS